MKKVLIADDDIDDTELFCEALQEVDPTIHPSVAYNCSELLEKLKTTARPDIIFLDINMPDMNGWDCLTILKDDPDYKAIPVIMYTTSSSPRDVEKASKLGARLLFTKPDRFSDLKQRLGQMISEHSQV